MPAPAFLMIAAAFASAVVMALTLAHALELPGKRRLDRDHYLATQAIYYPGFTWAGIVEPLTSILLVALLATTPMEARAFWLLMGALLASLAVQLIFWTVTQRINKYWLETIELSGAAKRLFGTIEDASRPPWTEMRDRWDRSHLLRALAATIGYLLLLTALLG
jgi:hypothetical protein